MLLSRDGSGAHDRGIPFLKAFRQVLKVCLKKSKPFLKTIDFKALLQKKVWITTDHENKLGVNLDVPFIKTGSIVYLPVEVPRDLFSVGDVHAR